MVTPGEYTTPLLDRELYELPARRRISRWVAKQTERVAAGPEPSSGRATAGETERVAAGQEVPEPGEPADPFPSAPELEVEVRKR